MAIITTVQALSPQASPSIIPPIISGGAGGGDFDWLKFIDKAEGILKVVDSIVSKSDNIKNIFTNVAERKGQGVQSQPEPIRSEVTVVKNHETQKIVEVPVMKKLTPEMVQAYLEELALRVPSLKPEWKDKTLSQYAEFYNSSGSLKKSMLHEYVAETINDLIEKGGQ